MASQKKDEAQTKATRAKLEKYVTSRMDNQDFDKNRSDKLLFSNDETYKGLQERAETTAAIVKSFDDISKVNSESLEKCAKAYKDLDEYANKVRSSNYLDVGNKNEATKLNNLSMQIERYLALNDKIARDPVLAKEFEKLNDSAKNATTTFPDASKKFSELKVAAEDAGLASQSLGERLKKLFNDHLKTAIVMAGLHLIQTGLREIYQNVVDIDTAMTNLRKVSTGSAADYDQFLSGAATRAKKLGATITDVIDASSEFSRLGFNLDESSILGDAAVMYKNVSEYENIEEASQSIVSTMQAFNIQAENVMSIVDRFNEVGKLIA